jgi:Ca2+-binding RTX toxin-like protein
VAGVLLLPVVVAAPAANAATPNRVAIEPSSVSPVLRDLVVTTGAAADRVIVRRDGAAYVVDVCTGATAGTGCEAASATTVRCPLPATAITRVAVDVGAGDDAVTVGAGVPRALLRGGAGDDNANTLTGGPGADVISAGDGADRVYGDGGSDAIDGGTGDDWIDDGNGTDRVSGGAGDDEFEPSQSGSPAQADLYDGGDGADTMAYWGMRSPYAGVVVSLNGRADDGVPGENDNVLGFETVIGTYLDDRLTGGPGEETLVGFDGADVLDTVDGAPGDWADGGNGTTDTCLVDTGDTAVDCES